MRVKHVFKYLNVAYSLSWYICRNKRKLLTGNGMADTDRVMEGLIVYNGLEIKIASSTLKVSSTKLH